MAKYLIEDASLVSIADAIREKTNQDELLSIPAIIDSINGFETSNYMIETGQVRFPEACYPTTDTPVIINHSLGKIPLFFFGVNGQAGYYVKYEVCYVIANGGIRPSRAVSNGIIYATSTGSDNFGVLKGKITLTSDAITIATNSTNIGFNAGNKDVDSVLTWFAIAEK